MADYEIFSFIYSRPHMARNIAVVFPDKTVRSIPRAELIALIDAGNTVTSGGYDLSMLEDETAGVRWIAAPPASAGVTVMRDRLAFTDDADVGE